MDAWMLLQTFPGWPEVNEPSTMYMLMLCIGGPLLLGAIVGALVLGASRRSDVVAEERAAGLAIDDEDPNAMRHAVTQGEAHAADGTVAGMEPYPVHGGEGRGAAVQTEQTDGSQLEEQQEMDQRRVHDGGMEGDHYDQQQRPSGGASVTR